MSHAPSRDPDQARAGHVSLPALAEPHAHLDKAFLAEIVPNDSGDLMGAILAMEAYGHLITESDTEARAERAARLLHANGCTAIRTHVDIMAERADPLLSLRALLAVREKLRGTVEIQIAGLSGWPSLGSAGAEQRAVYADAIAMGLDLVGGCPHLEDDPVAANEHFLQVGADAGLPVDLHTDETLDPTKFALDDLSLRVAASGFPHAVTASHCVSLGVHDEATQQRVAEQVAAAGISVIVLPHTNLFLQGRDHQAAMPRGLTAVRALRRAGVVLAAGGDNLQDPFNPVGRGDPLETAGLMIMAAHLLPEEALDAVSVQARRAMGLPATGDRVVVPAATVREAIALGPSGRTLVRSS